MTLEFLRVIYTCKLYPQIHPEAALDMDNIIWNKILTATINPDSSEVCFKIMLKKRNLTRGYNSY